MNKYWLSTFILLVPAVLQAQSFGSSSGDDKIAAIMQTNYCVNAPGNLADYEKAILSTLCDSGSNMDGAIAAQAQQAGGGASSSTLHSISQMVFGSSASPTAPSAAQPSTASTAAPTAPAQNNAAAPAPVNKPAAAGIYSNS